MDLPECKERRQFGNDIVCKKHEEQMTYEVALGRCKCSEKTRIGETT